MDEPRKFCPNCGAKIFNYQQIRCFNCGKQLTAVQEVQNYNLITAWTSFFKKYVDFKGRSRRSEYWYAYLANLIIGGIISIIMMIALIAAMSATSISALNMAMGIYGICIFVAVIYSLATMIPNFAIQTRRLHDTGKSGKLLLLWLIPGVLMLISTILMCSAVIGAETASSYYYYSSYSSSSLEGFESMLICAAIGYVIAAMVALVLAILFLVFYCEDSQRGANKYGMSPKYLS